MVEEEEREEQGLGSRYIGRMGREGGEGGEEVLIMCVRVCACGGVG